MKYKDMVEKIAKTGVSEIERGEMVIRRMANMIDIILDYKYVVEHYNGGETSTKLADEVNCIKNELAILVSELDIYMETLCITDKVKEKAENRAARILRKINQRND